MRQAKLLCIHIVDSDIEHQLLCHPTSSSSTSSSNSSNSSSFSSSNEGEPSLKVARNARAAQGRPQRVQVAFGTWGMCLMQNCIALVIYPRKSGSLRIWLQRSRCLPTRQEQSQPPNRPVRLRNQVLNRSPNQPHAQLPQLHQPVRHALCLLCKLDAPPPPLGKGISRQTVVPNHSKMVQHEPSSKPKTTDEHQWSCWRGRLH